MEKQTLKMSVRTGSGKGVTKKLRKDGLIPAVLYGHRTESRITQLPSSESIIFEKMKGKTVFYVLESSDVVLNGKRVLVKELLRDPMNDRIMHIDFYEIPENEMIKVHVPLKLRGKEVVVKNGGVIEWDKREVEIKGFPEEMPDFIEVDVSGLAIGHSIHLSEIKLPANTQLVDDGGIAVVSVHHPRQEEELSAEEKAAKLEASLAEKEKPGAAPAAGAPAKEAKKAK